MNLYTVLVSGTELNFELQPWADVAALVEVVAAVLCESVGLPCPLVMDVARFV